MPDSVAPLLLPPDVLHAMQAMGCGYWQWDVVQRQLQFAGAFYHPFGVFEQPPEQVFYDDGLTYSMPPAPQKKRFRRIRRLARLRRHLEDQSKDLAG